MHLAFRTVAGARLLEPLFLQNVVHLATVKHMEHLCVHEFACKFAGDEIQLLRCYTFIAYKGSHGNVGKFLCKVESNEND